MKNYLFKTYTTMKPYNNQKWWINSDLVSEKKIQAESLEDALKKYCEKIEKDHSVVVSDNALKKKEPMFTDTRAEAHKQIGYVITAKTGFLNDAGDFVDQFIELLVEVLEINTPHFD